MIDGLEHGVVGGLSSDLGSVDLSMNIWKQIDVKSKVWPCLKRRM
jgi:hypothetical protein